MNAIATLGKIRDLAESRMLELQPMAGEEMNLPQTDARRDGFVAGERAMAQQVLLLLEGFEEHGVQKLEPMEAEMVLDLGRT